jgi:putative ABC transport system permease protein
MFAYYFQLGVRSLRRNPVLTSLMVLTIAVGVAASMATFAVFRAVSGDPIPDKSAQLFKPQIDSWGPVSNTDGDPIASMDYTDAMALMRAHKAQQQVVSYPVDLSVFPNDPASRPFEQAGYASYSDFFSMFEVPFKYGSAWSIAQDAEHGNQVVISSKLNQRLFGGVNSVGRTIDLSDNEFRVVGVIQPWDPQPRFYDVVNGRTFANPPQLWISFTRAIDLQIPTSGHRACTANSRAGFAGLLQSDCIWLSYWAELPTPSAAADYTRYLQSYAADQQRAGRFTWAAKVRLSSVTQWLDLQQVVPPESKVALLLSLGFLVVCLVNTIGLLLAKFMRRAPEIGVRRALGASRAAIYQQFLIEATMVGLAGGVLGLLLTAGAVGGIGLVFTPQIARLAHVDLTLLVLTVMVAVAATVIAAFYPTWRASRVQPAWQLRAN